YISDPAHPVPYTEDVHLGRTREYMTDDQRFASRRTDVLTFSTDVLSEDITVAGPVIADLVTSISTTDADFVVKIIDVFPDTFRYENNYLSARPGTQAYPMGGYQMLVRGEIMRGRYRNSFEKPEAFKPNERTNVKFTLPDIAHTFKKGHKLMIQVQSSWFPLADRNPQKFVNIYTCDDSDFQKATIRIYDDSKIILPVLK
ncbi:MAG TPA: CocE/NonD family hydrolase, partial [Ferruginibacter sp.]|nr:CocE/NonD family hydrolase [Ferruginibacter sp.]